MGMTLRTTKNIATHNVPVKSDLFDRKQKFYKDRFKFLMDEKRRIKEEEYQQLLKIKAEEEADPMPF